MRVISNKKLRSAGAENPDLDVALQSWRKTLEKSAFYNFAELKTAFNSVDRVGDYYVFNIKGNQFRLICWISFEHQTCYVKHVLSHADYDRGKWK